MRITSIGVRAMDGLFARRLSHLAGIAMLGHWEAQLKILKKNGIFSIRQK
jgi:hypothetical protein